MKSFKEAGNLISNHSEFCLQKQKSTFAFAFLTFCFHIEAQSNKGNNPLINQQKDLWVSVYFSSAFFLLLFSFYDFTV